ncbi:SOS response-associated peptidase family protein [Enterococcus larvae]|uniref:SOS response-associated peptidase family protein n=1 Tax=Enterococcus larvae TaxID=2794352 RepID=UPI003F3A9538
MMQCPWGFKGFKGSQLIINARSETVTEKRMFAAAFKKDRCVFPTLGFYEWSPEKEKFFPGK